LEQVIWAGIAGCLIAHAGKPTAATSVLSDEPLEITATAVAMNHHVTVRAYTCQVILVHDDAKRAYLRITLSAAYFVLRIMASHQP
jgi:hypothetical protein